MSHYKPYPAYKDSGVEWIGLVPEHWEVKPFKYILSAPMSYGANESAESDDPNHPRYIRITDLTENGTLREDTFKTLPWDKAYSYLLSDGDILLARSGATVGKSFLYRETNGAACFAGYLIKASCDEEKALPKYIYAYLQSHSYWEYISGSNIQSTIQNVSAEKYSSMVLPVPQREEQATIAAALERETARIDTLIQKKARFIELLKEKRQALITHAVTKGLDPNVKMKDSGVEWIGQVPEHWEVARIKRLASLRNERRNDAPTNTTYIGLEDVEAGSGRYRPTNGSSRQSENSTVGIFYDGDVLYGKLRPYLRKAIVSEMAGCCSTEFLILRAKKIEPKWLQEWLLTPDVTHQIESGCEGAKMPRADWWHIGSIEAVYPDQYEQAQILATLDRQTARIDALIGKAHFHILSAARVNSH